MAKKKLKIESEISETITGATETQTDNNSENITNDGIVNDESKSFDEYSAEKTEESAEVKTSLPKNDDGNLNVDAILKQYAEPVPEAKQKRTRRKKVVEPEPVKTQFIIPGKLFVTVCDNTLTGAIGALDSWLSKDPIDIDLLKLRKEQVDELAPLAEEAIKAMKLENDPISVYFGSLAAIYLSNYLTLKAFMTKSNKENGNQ